MKLKPGIYYNLMDDCYHNELEGYLSKSKLSKFSDNPRKAEIPFAATPAMELGSAFHCRLLQPKLWDKEYVIGLNLPKRKNVDKETWRIFELENQNKTIVKPADYQIISDMVGEVKEQSIAADWLRDGKAEVTVIGELEGLPAKARLDYLHDSNLCIVDIKTAAEGEAKEFARSIAKYKYHWQAAIYIDLLEQHVDIKNTPIEWKFIVIEKTEPYLVYTYTLDTMAIAQGRAEYKEAIRDYKKYIEMNRVIPCIDENISLPMWARKDIKFDGLKAKGN